MTYANVMDDAEHVSAKDYFASFHAKSIVPVLTDFLQIRIGRDFDRIASEIPKAAFAIAYEQVHYSENLPVPNAISYLLTGEYSKKEQIAKLKGLAIKPEQLVTIFLYAEKLGYDFSTYRFEGKPVKFDSKELPFIIHLLDDDAVEHIGETCLSDGQLKELFIASKFAVARILDNGKHWHCLYQTKRGISGKEPGRYGKLSHIHYISDSFGITRTDFIKAFKSGYIPSSNVHIVLDG